MPFYVPFDKYETAVLVDAYMEVEKGRIKKDEAVRKISEDLRKRAIDSGRIIDDKFRCISGISSQWRKLRIVIEKGDRADKYTTVSQVFKEVVNMFFHNKGQFEKILNSGRETPDILHSRMKECPVNEQKKQNQYNIEQYPTLHLKNREK